LTIGFSPPKPKGGAVGVRVATLIAATMRKGIRKNRISQM
jgi:hypothetical protein